MHCSDEQLLAHLDGELSTFHRVRVERHLRSCWRCRTRRSACEQEIQKLTVAVDEWPFPESGWIQETGRKLNQRIQDCEQDLSMHPRRSFGGWAIPAFATAAAVALCVSGWFWWRGPANPQLRPADVIARVSRAEQTAYVQPVLQTFAVEIAEIRPARKTVKAKLQVWADHQSGRFASRFSDDKGALQHALWRPSADTEFVYRAALSSQVRKQQPHREEVVALESLADYGMDSVKLEEAFLHWMESRSWSPISFASDFSSWTAEDGSLATAERLPAKDGTPTIRITAQRQSRKMVAVLTVEVDSTSYWPRLQTIRFETDERAVEFRLMATSIRPIQPSEMMASVFLPSAEAAPGISVVRPVLPRLETPRDVPDSEPASSVPTIDPRVVEASFVLHQAGACLGEAVRVSEDPGGSKVERLGIEPGSYRSELDLGYMLSALTDLRRDQPARGDNGPRAMATRHAWALRRLAEDFPARPIAGLPAASWQALESMLHDHVSAVRRELVGLGLRVGSTPTSREQTSDWRTSAARLFASIRDASAEDINSRLDEIERSFSVESKHRNERRLAR
jgi:hypothetical protein